MNGENDQKRGASARSQRAKAEANIAKRLLNAMPVVSDFNDIKDLKASKKEIQVLTDISNSGVLEGVAATCLTYFLLRRVRSIFVRIARSEPAATTRTTPPPRPFASSTPGNGFSSTTGSSSATGWPHVVNSPFQPPPPPSQIPSVLPPTEGSSPPINGGTSKQNKWFWRLHDVLAWILDFSASVVVGSIVSTKVMFNKDAVDKMAELPLIEGKSIMAEVYCPSILEEYLKLKQELKASGQETSSAQQMDSDTQEQFSFSLDKAEPSISLDIQRAALEEPNSLLIKLLLKFAANCHRRASYEKKLAREGTTVGFPTKPFAMDIPPPGVPADFQVGDDDTEDEGTDEFNFPSSSFESQDDETSFISGVDSEPKSK